MRFHWWWIFITLATIWIVGWLVSVVFGVFFNPLDSDEDKRKDFRGRLLAQSVVNWFLWPWLLPAVLDRRKLKRDMETGKRPNWIMLADGEESGRQWTLSDGTEFGASVSTAGESSESAHISGDYEDESLTWKVQYRVRMIAPSPQPPSDWAPMEFTPRGPEPDPDDEDAVDDYMASRYEASVKLERGKYEVEFQVPNRAGKAENCSAVTLIVSDLEDYNL
jgi:hypothetical protein